MTSNRIFFAVAIAAEDLDCFSRYAHSNVGSNAFCDSSVNGEGFAFLFLASSFVNEVTGSFDLHLHVSQFEGNGLEFAERFAELYTLFGVFNSICQCSFCNAESLSSNADTAAVQSHHSDLEAFAFFAEHVFSRNFDVLEYEFHGLRSMDAHLVFFLTESEARHAVFEDEGCNAVVAFALVGHSEDDVDISSAAVGDENLGAVQRVCAVVVLNSNSLLAGSISTSVRFGQAESTEFSTFNQRNEEFFFLSFCTELPNRVSAKGNRCRQCDSNTSVVFSQFFNSEDVAQNVAAVIAGTAVFFFEVSAGNTEAEQFIDKVFVINTFVVAFRNGRS